MSTSVRIKGIAEIARNLERAARAAGDVTASGNRMLGESIMTDVKAASSGKGVPVDEGTLRSSGRVSGTKVVRLTFGGAAAPYALYQHEVVGLRHRVGEARYLVRGVERAVAGGTVQAALDQIGDEVVGIMAGRS